MLRKFPVRLINDRSRFWIPAILLTLAWGGLLVWQLYLSNSLLSDVENQSFDWRIRNGQHAAVNPDLVFVSFDSSVSEILFPEDIEGNPALEMMVTQWPWNRTLWALAIERLAQAGAKVVAIDIAFEGSNPEQDAPLKAAIDRYADQVVLAIREETTLTSGRYSATLTAISSTLIPDWDEELYTSEGRLGLVNIVPDFDQVVRHYIYKGKGFLQPDVDAFATRILRKAGLHAEVESLPDRAMIRYSPPPPHNYSPVMLWDLFLEDSWQRTFKNGEFFKDKIVLIGPYGTGFKDVHQTPIAKDPPLAGPQIHLNAVAAALHHDFIKTYSSTGYLITLLIALLLPFPLFLIFTNRSWCYLVWLGGTVLLPVTAFVVYNQQATLIPLVFPFLAWNGIWLVLISLETIRSWLEKKRIRSTLDRYLSKEVASTLIFSKQGYYTALGGVRKEAVVLFSDLRNFTTLSENADPAELVTQLNEYLTEMVEEIFRQNGRLDKFMGDAVMAVWGDLYDLPPQQSCIQAVNTAIGMLQRLQRLNERWQLQGHAPLSMGIGIHAGELIFGNLGSEQRMELTVIGDTVNLGSRLEGLTKTYGVPLLVSDSVARATSSQFAWKSVDTVQVKGRSQSLEIFTLEDSTLYI